MRENGEPGGTGRGFLLFFLPTLILSVAVLAWQARFLDFIVDDVFIPLRYAENLLAGEGMVFNPGERVEGYTDFLWVLLGAGLLRLPVDPPAAMRGLAFASGTALLALTPLLHRRFLTRGNGNVSLLIAPLLACSTSFALWSSAGMETALFSLLVTAGLLLSLGEGAFITAAASCLLLACLTRPEGHLFAAMALLGLLWRRRREGRPLLDRRTTAAAGICAAVLFAYHGWRIAYFGHLLPNTFAAKVGSGGDQFLRGISYMGEFFRTGGSLLLLLPLGLVISRRGDRRVTVTAAMVALYVVYVVLVGGDSMLASRFVVPVLPLWLCLIVAVLEDISAVVRERFGSPSLAVALVGVLALALGMGSLQTGDDAYMTEVRRRAAAVRRWAEVGKRLGRRLPPGSHIALGAVGAIPYYSGFRTTDLFGLTDPVIARTRSEEMGRGFAGHERSNVDRVLERSPDYILSYVVLTDVPLERDDLGLLFRGTPAERDVWSSEEVHRLYRPASLDLGAGYLNLLARRAERGTQ